jgi:hypothetical protein
VEVTSIDIAYIIRNGILSDNHEVEFIGGFLKGCDNHRVAFKVFPSLM